MHFAIKKVRVTELVWPPPSSPTQPSAANPFSGGPTVFIWETRESSWSCCCLPRLGKVQMYKMLKIRGLRVHSSDLPECLQFTSSVVLGKLISLDFRFFVSKVGTADIVSG